MNVWKNQWGEVLPEMWRLWAYKTFETFSSVVSLFKDRILQSELTYRRNKEGLNKNI